PTSNIPIFIIIGILIHSTGPEPRVFGDDAPYLVCPNIKQLLYANPSSGRAERIRGCGVFELWKNIDWIETWKCERVDLDGGWTVRKAGPQNACLIVSMRGRTPIENLRAERTKLQAMQLPLPPSSLQLLR